MDTAAADDEDEMVLKVAKVSSTSKACEEECAQDSRMSIRITTSGYLTLKGLCFVLQFLFFIG